MYVSCFTILINPLMQLFYRNDYIFRQKIVKVYYLYMCLCPYIVNGQQIFIENQLGFRYLGLSTEQNKNHMKLLFLHFFLE